MNMGPKDESIIDKSFPLYRAKFSKFSMYKWQSTRREAIPWDFL
jgi:hypothetical protein